MKIFKKSEKLIIVFMLLGSLIGSRVYAEESRRRRVVVKMIDFTGLEYFRKVEILRLMKTKKRIFFWGGIFKEDVLGQDIENIKQTYKAQGFSEVEVTAGKRFTKKGKAVYLTIHIKEGKKAGSEEISSVREELKKETVNKEEIDKTKAAGKKKEDIRQRLEEKEQAINLLSGYLEKVKHEKKDLANQVGEYERENKNLKTIIDVEISKRRELEKEIDSLKEVVEKNKKENKVLKEKLVSIGEIFEEKMKAISKAKEIFDSAVADVNLSVKKELEAVELKPIVVSPVRSMQPVSASRGITFPSREGNKTVAKAVISGKVVVVKERLNFVIVNVGMMNGVEIGMVFSICRDDEMLARAKVIEVRENVSALDIELQKEDAFIREGDLVNYPLIIPQVSFLYGEVNTKVA